jgi:L-cystine transport system permease protein
VNYVGIFDPVFALEKLPEVLKAVPATILVAVVGMGFGLIIGIFVALVRLYRVPVLSRLATVYISFIRGTPMLVQLYLIFYGIPELFNFKADLISPFAYAFIAYSINSSAFQAEAVRSAFNSIDAGQMEAAYSVGMTTFQGIRRIIVPQALTAVLPNLGNIFIGLVKGTSLAFAVKVVEIMAVAKTISGTSYRFIEMYVDAAIIYWILCFVLERLFAKAEKLSINSAAATPQKSEKKEAVCEAACA